VQGSSFTQAAFGSSVTPPVFAPGVDLTTLAINTVPFGIAVGGGVLQGAGPGLLDNLSISDLQQILAGTVTNWTTIGNTTDTAGQTNITVCQRTVGSGTLATLDKTIMKKGPRSINPTRNPAAGPPALGAVANLSNAGSGNIVECMNNALVAGVNVNPNHRMSIGYIDSDSLPLLTTGAHFVKINGFQVFDPTLPATSARLKDLRCGDYPYWANWNMVIRTNGVDGLPITGGGTVPVGTQAVLEAYVDSAITNNPLPGFWATQADMFVTKNDDAGPHTNIAGGATFCQKAN
jgi:ABC-type phosphate transport system substrate-binding protein